MDSYQVKECQKIIRELLKTPLGQIFKTIDARSIPGYLNVIQRPMDFDTVERRLKNGEYRSTHEYAKDIKKIFSNCRKFNKDSKYFIGAADLCEKEFFKLYRKIKATQEEGWLTEVIEISQKLKNCTDKIKKLSQNKN